MFDGVRERYLTVKTEAQLFILGPKKSILIAALMHINKLIW